MRRKLLVFLLLALLAIIIVLAFYSGLFWNFDDSTYYLLSIAAVHNSFNPASNPYGYGWAFPYFVAIGGLVFGFSFHGIVISTAIEYFSLIVLTYILAFRLTKKRNLAIASALIITITPFVLQYSTRLINDMLLGVIATLSMILFISERKIDWYLSGIMAGALIYIKLIGFAYIIFFGLIAIASNKRKYVIPMIILMLLVYTIPFAILVHNPFYSFKNYGLFQHSLSPAGTVYSNIVDLFVVLGIIRISPLDPLIYQIYSLGLFIFLALVGSLLSITNKNKNMLYLSWLFLGYFLYLYFGTISISAYYVGITIPRYFILIAAPFAILIAYAFDCTYDIVRRLSEAIRPLKKYSKTIALAAVVLLFIIMILTTLNTYELIYAYNRDIRTGTPLPSSPGTSQGNLTSNSKIYSNLILQRSY